MPHDSIRDVDRCRQSGHVMDAHDVSTVRDRERNRGRGSDLALAYLQASRRAPALPATMSVIATVLALLNAVWLAVDVAVSHPPQQSVWAPIGLAAACGLLAGAFLSLRQEGVGARDERTDIPTVAASGGVRS